MFVQGPGGSGVQQLAMFPQLLEYRLDGTHVRALENMHLIRRADADLGYHQLGY